MDCQEVAEGYKVHYTPMAPGNYLISIKYGGPNHISGSPFKAKVTGSRLVSVTNASETSTLTVDPVLRSSSSFLQSVMPRLGDSDASKVQIRGPGLSKASVGRRSSFSVDCSKAGKNMLQVGVYGPEVPCEEVLVKHMGGLQYNVSYLLNERGSYILVVKWGDDHVLFTLPSHCQTRWSSGFLGFSYTRRFLHEWVGKLAPFCIWGNVCVCLRWS
uniref:Uncharacterized protein n=1 Tax=Salarias fasciatus TaxID=181472 RepID=A0A672HLI4_SALFA